MFCFFPIPKPKTRPDDSLKWVRSCNRKNFTVKQLNKHSYVCSKHFIDGWPTDRNPYPTTAGDNLFTFRPPRRPPLIRLAPEKNINADIQDAVPIPSKFEEVWDSVTDVVSTDSLPTTYDSPPGGDDDVNMDQPNGLNSAGQCFVDDHDYAMSVGKSAMNGDAHAQSNITMQDISHLPDRAFLNEGILKRTLMMRDIFRDSSSCNHYTGLSIGMFEFILNLLQEKAEKMTYWRSSETTDGRQTHRRGPRRMLTLKEELAVTLTRLRRGIDTVTLGNMFGISEASLSRIVITWVSLIAAELKYLIRWPSREQIRHKLPACFKHYPKTRSIIDCTEIFVQKPSLPSAQRVTFSQYKHHNTFKCLVSITPTGTFSFISELYSGSISDKRIVVDSKFLDKIEHGDDIMADRGFLIRGELALRGATLNIPPFSNGKQMCPEAVTKTRRIAHARIHVERAIGRLKNFEILQKVIPLKMQKIMNKIVLVCAILCNLDNQLVK